MSKREELEKQSSAFKNAFKNQVDNLKGDMNKVGKSALMIGGGLLATYLLVDAITGKKKKKNKNKNKEKGGGEEASLKKPIKDNLLLSTAKEQAIVFLLGLAAQKLASFLSELETTDEEENS